MDTVYVVSSLNDVEISSGDTSSLEAYLVDAKTGKRIEGCSKQFNPFDYGATTQDSLVFGIIGEERELVSCGGNEDGVCYNHDFASGDVGLSADGAITQGPYPLAASFIDGADSSWLTVGG